MHRTGFALRFHNGDWVGVGAESGYMPYAAQHVAHIQLWDEKRDVLSFLQRWQDELRPVIFALTLEATPLYSEHVDVSQIGAPS